MAPETALVRIVLLGALTAHFACTPATARFSDDGATSADAGSPGGGESAADAGSRDPGDGGPASWLPAPPTALEFAWQGSQQRLIHSETHEVCEEAGIVVALWDRAVCYGASDGELMCAGSIGGTIFGANFVPAGIQDVVQLLGSGTFNSASGSSACALKGDGSAWCFGYGTSPGLFDTADGEQPGATWTQWGSRSDIVGLATGTMDSICAVYEDKTASCAGLDVPQTINANDARSLWIDSFGQVQVNDEAVFRASSIRSACVVTAKGLTCTEPPEVVMPFDFIGEGSGKHGVLVTPTADGGNIVDGGASGLSGLCWLTSSGAVSCHETEEAPLPEELPTRREYFENQRALALAVNMYDEGKSRCAVISDGSLWCIGSNALGGLGSGSSGPLTVETQVQPAGSVQINCPPIN